MQHQKNVRDAVMWVLFWVVLALVVGIFASGRGRSGVGWFLLSLLLSPLVGFVLVAVLQNLSGTQQAASGVIAPGPDTHVRCKACQEWVQPMATVCKHCGAALVPNLLFEENRQLAEAAKKSDDLARSMFGWIALAAVVALLILMSRCSP